MTATIRSYSPPQRIDEVEDRIREYIAENRLGPGTALPSEHWFVTELGVGRPLVREAFRKLEAIGLVEARRGVGRFVGSFDLQSYLQHVPTDVLMDNLTQRELEETRTLLSHTLIADASLQMSDKLRQRLFVVRDQVQHAFEEGYVDRDADRSLVEILRDSGSNRLVIALLESVLALRERLPDTGSIGSEISGEYATRMQFLNALLSLDEEGQSVDVMPPSIHLSSMTRRDLLHASAFASGLSGLPAMSVAYNTPFPTYGGRITTALMGEPDTLDPHRTRFALSAAVFGNILETLVGRTSDLDFEGILAERWDISPDGLLYTFHLRKDILFHDGTGFDARAVVATFERFKGESLFAYLMDPVVSITAPSPFIVQFRLSQPMASFLDTLAAPYMGILPPTVTRNSGSEFGSSPIGTGPWRFREWIPGKHIIIEANPAYVNHSSRSNRKGPPLLDEVVLRFVPHAEQPALFDACELDILAIPSEDLPRYRSMPGIDLHTTEGGTISCFMEFAMLPPAASDPVRFKAPFDDPRVRKAIAIGVDIDAIVARTMDGVAVRNYGPLPSGVFAYNPEIAEYGFQYDSSAAQHLLDEAGWQLEGGVRVRDGVPLVLKLWTFNDASMQQFAMAIRDSLADLGVDLSIEVMPAGEMIARAPGSDADLFLSTCGWSEPDLIYLMTNTEFGVGLYRDPAFQSLVIQARQTIDREHRASLYFEAEKKMLADVALIPLVTYIGVVATRKEVRDFRLGPQGVFVLDDAYVLPSQ
ncbi:MAG: GntR family transcriptional regulator [Thermomicrobiales bacterium]|nr:GntR family transcriptional regulator [Thermomicrobiales bacterium]